jgi:hypothetical protein
MITTAAGRGAVESAGLIPIVADVEKGGFYRF